MFFGQERVMSFMVAVVAISLSFSLVAYWKNLPVIQKGPQVPISEVTKSLVDSGTLHTPYFDEIAREGVDLSRARSAQFTQDVFALNRNGGFVPKHSIISAVIAVPFYAAFGTIGFWLLQQLCFLWILYSTYRISQVLAGRTLPGITLTSVMLLSPALFYSYDYSYDLHGTAFVIGGLWIQRRYPFLGSLIVGLSLFVRPSFAIIVLPSAFAWLRESRVPNYFARAVSGMFSACLLYLCTNYLLYGSPFDTAYSRLPMFDHGRMVPSYHPVGFSLEVLLSDWGTKLFSPVGIFPHTLCVLGLPCLIFKSLRSPSWSFQNFCLAVALIYSVYVFSYPSWGASYYGNRFLLPAIFLYLQAFIPWLSQQITRVDVE